MSLSRNVPADVRFLYDKSSLWDTIKDTLTGQYKAGALVSNFGPRRYPKQVLQDALVLATSRTESLELPVEALRSCMQLVVTSDS